jgi:hypothetical protein
MSNCKTAREDKESGVKQRLVASLYPFQKDIRIGNILSQQRKVKRLKRIITNNPKAVENTTSKKHVSFIGDGSNKKEEEECEEVVHKVTIMRSGIKVISDA